MPRFMDEYQEISGSYLKAPEKEMLAENGIPFQVVAVVRADDTFNAGQERYILKVLVPDVDTGDAEEKLLAFGIGTVESRDRMLGSLSTYLEGEDAEPVILKLEKVGRSWILRDGE